MWSHELFAAARTIRNLLFLQHDLSKYKTSTRCSSVISVTAFGRRRMSLLLSVPRRSARERQGVFEVILDISTIRPEDSRAAWRQQAGYLNDGCARLYEIRRNPSNPASAFCPTLALQLLNSRPFYLRSASHKLSRWSCASWLSIVSPRDRGSTGRCGCGALERSTHLVGSGHFSNRFTSPRLGGHAGRCEREHHHQFP
jgi:hypothetical protein